MARYSGVFASAPPQKEKKLPSVLVARKNLFEDIRIGQNDVTIRQMSQREYADFQRDPTRYLPPLREAAENRITQVAIPAGEPLLREHFKELAFPEGLDERLGPGMRAVHVSVPREKAAGGLIRRNDFVDVYLSAKVCPGGDCDNASTKTARIARNLKVIAKRDSLWTLMIPIKKDEPSNFILEANPYRAALIEFGKIKGDISLVPVPKADKKGGYPGVSFLDSREFGDEDTKVRQFLRGEISIGEEDLERIFQLRLTPEEQPFQVQRIGGVNLKTPILLSKQGVVYTPPESGSGSRSGQSYLNNDRNNQKTQGFRFQPPSAKDGSNHR